jgi:hypothetical protein
MNATLSLNLSGCAIGIDKVFDKGTDKKTCKVVEDAESSGCFIT